MFKKIFLVFCLILLATQYQLREKSIVTEEVSAIPWPYTLCGDGDWTVQKVTIGQVPKRNSNNDITITGTANDAISFKKFALDVKLNNVNLHDETGAFENSYDAGDTVQFSFKQFVPGFAPSGTYLLSFQFIDSNGKNNGCISFSFKL